MPGKTGKLLGKDINEGLHACMQTLAAIKLAMEDGSKLTDLQIVEAVNTLDLIKGQADYMLPDFQRKEKGGK